MKYIICIIMVVLYVVYVCLFTYGEKKVFNKLENTLEQQEKKELRFEICYKIVPPVLFFIMIIGCVLLKYFNHI